MKALNILIAPDKFKGTLDARAAAEAIQAGWLRVRPQDRIECVPVSDGGEGFLQVCESVGAGRREAMTVAGPAGAPVRLEVLHRGGMTFFETSNACGLALLPEALRNPCFTSTLGVGEVLRQLAKKGMKHAQVGLGGSGTNDGGTGMACALGYRFLDSLDRDLPKGAIHLNKLAHIVSPDSKEWPCVSAGTDVTNPLTGPEGCTRRFGVQKGMKPEDESALEAGLVRLDEVVQRDLGRAEAQTPGSGAAGGLGYGLAVFCGARLVSGFDLVSSALDLSNRLAWADVVVTGEGSLDRQSLSGKAPVAIARLAAKLGKPTMCAAGIIEDSLEWGSLFHTVVSTTKCAGTAAEAKKEAALWLAEAGTRLARTF